ncbi:Putative Holin-X, holin superfamily III [Micromonospora purpureochromogenes]|uniref:Putative Holin-X, holin superfamily III n=1 Tax=Micromonospora purpureochromogenes TaxID=47872 RepID=A0A1C4ZPI8_9ACTN|nr:phage holin family protein [Micromonospora purpureochromogenes]SCF34960.1 Putative Holin-X, holin superfamily III [Micromonospora purpureochromogenes]
MSDAAAGRSGGIGRAAGPTDRLAAEVAEVVRAEVREVRTHVLRAVRPAGVGLALLATAGGCVVLGAGAASATALRLLETFLPRRLATAGLTGGYLVAAVVLGRAGLTQLRAAGGGPAWLADEMQDAVSATASQVVPAGAAAVREEFDRWASDRQGH